MWGDSWINLQMKMRDMPYYHYKRNNDSTGSQNTKDSGVKEGTIDILKQKFAKYIE